MDKQTAINIVRETFQNPFEKNRFILFSKNLLNKIDESKAFHARGYVPEIFKDHIKTYERIATYTDPEEKKTDILIVYLQKETTLDKARTAQRNFIARYLKDRGEKDAGLIAFVAPDVKDWRFSFVKMEYKFTETPKGAIKAKEEFTPARRYSFLVGKNENSHTAQSSLVPLLREDEHNPTLKEIEETFSIERVTKEFFEKYRELFLKVKEALDGIVGKDANIKKDFTQKGVSTIDFAKKLLGQIVFLYFLQKKGWFGVGRDADWGTGPKDFLRLLFEKRIANYKNFFNDILEPLFYEALANERTADFYSRFNCKIPFLNGGLFDPINNYDWVHTDILLPNELFSNDVKTKESDTGTGILDVFDRYNFTVKEDEPLEKEVAIDPEMLGKVFENLLEVKDRKSRGTYYTPREIVHYMCQESLINYLVAELTSSVIASETKQSLPDREDIKTFLRYGETAIEHDSRVENHGKETERYSYKLPESIRSNAELIDEKLANIRVCDPAIGSGAFPVAMMHEIVKARETLSAYLSLRGSEATKQSQVSPRHSERSEESRTPYNFKRHAIQNCLYGVDIDPGAVEIAKLRLWLSLMVDEEDIKHIKPLPNLDYKIMQGNSLLEEFEGIKLFDEKLIESKTFDNHEEIKRLKERQSVLQKEYFQLHNSGKLTTVKKFQFETELQNIKDSIKHLLEIPKTNEKQRALVYSAEANKKAVQLKKLHQEFFEASQKSKKDELKKQVEELEWDLIETTLKAENKESALKNIEQFKKSNTRPFFLWKLNFSEVYQKGGFDIVIANPPYVRQEDIKELKPILQRQGYVVYNSTSDLYTYFYELSYNILASGGFSCFISSNKWMRAKYGEKLRNFFITRTMVRKLIDFGGHKVFDATVDTNIILFQKGEPQEEYQMPYVNIESDFTGDNLNGYIRKKQQTIKQYELSDSGWTLADDKVLALKKKIETIGTSLKDWGVKIYRGITTGCNEAFILTTSEKNEIVAKDSKTVKYLKPVLRGRDITRYSYQWNNLWLLYIPWHFPLHMDNTIQGASLKAEQELKKQYSVIFEHLSKYREQLLNRNKDETSIRYEWYSMQRCAATYYSEFEKEKIIIPEFGYEFNGVFDTTGKYCIDTAHIIIGTKYHLAILNSKLLNKYIAFIATGLGSKGIRFKPQFLEQLPIPKIPEKAQHPFITLVDRILAITKDEDYLENPAKQARVKEYERQIDEMVYKLYGLTDEEIKIVENFNNRG